MTTSNPDPTLPNNQPPAAAPPAVAHPPLVVAIVSGTTVSSPPEAASEPPPAAAPAPAPPAPAAPASAASAPAAVAPPPAETPAEEATREQATAPAQPATVAPASILTVDIGGTKVKILATGQTEPRKASSGKDFTPARLVETIRSLALEWEYEAVSIGLPALVGPQGPRSEPGNLGSGWVGFDYAAAFGKPVKMVNDAAMQALGSYEGGRMLFLGLGTGLGSTLITGHVVVPLELGRLLYDEENTLGEVLGRRGFERLGKRAWREAVRRAVTALMHAFVADYVVIGGGNAKNVKELPPGARKGHNLTAFRGGFRLWSAEDVWVLAASGGESPHPTAQEALRML
jgi:polyphosphate glucokinase